MPDSSMKTKGQTLIEVIVALAFVAITVPVIFTTISTTVGATDRLRDHSIRLELAQNQMEYIKSQQYHKASERYELIPTPEGYEIEVESQPVARYEYPGNETVLGGIQQITVTVTGRHGEVELEGFKVKKGK